MGLRAKLSAEIEIKSSPESYFKRLKEELHHLPDAASGVHGVEVHEDGKKETFKERFEIDEANWSVSMVAVGGHILVRYKSYKIIHKVIPATTDEPPMVRVTLVYEKYQETDADALKEIEFMITMMKDIDKHLLCQ